MQHDIARIIFTSFTLFCAFSSFRSSDIWRALSRHILALLITTVSHDITAIYGRYHSRVIIITRSLAWLISRFMSVFILPYGHLLPLRLTAFAGAWQILPATSILHAHRSSAAFRTRRYCDAPWGLVDYTSYPSHAPVEIIVHISLMALHDISLRIIASMLRRFDHFMFYYLVATTVNMRFAVCLESQLFTHALVIILIYVAHWRHFAIAFIFPYACIS